MPRANPSKNRYKSHFNHSGTPIRISVDKDGYANGVDYKFTVQDADSTALARSGLGYVCDINANGRRSCVIIPLPGK